MTKTDDTGCFEVGSFEVIADPILYGSGQITLNYRLHMEFAPENLSKLLSFIQGYYRQAYDQVLGGVFSAYQKNPKWDVWVDEIKSFVRIDFTQKEGLHAYMGMPIADLAFDQGKSLWGLTFPGGANQLSFEHGFCTVFEGEKLLVLADNDFPLVLQWFDYYCTKGNMLKTPVDR